MLQSGPFVILHHRHPAGQHHFGSPLMIRTALAMPTDQNLFPFNTHPPSTFFALNFILITSDPLPGSDMARLPTASPEISLGRYLDFCSSVPCRDT